MSRPSPRRRTCAPTSSGCRSTPRPGSRSYPSIGAYVGADIVADIVATGLVRDPETRLLVDVGTNGEIACGNAERSVATAAPAGPAFEGGEILYGMRATEGAIEGVTLTNGEIELQVIGGDVEPKGICGSGLIDIVAQLRLAGLLDDGGKMMTREAAEAIRHPLAGRIVMREDVRAFQLAGEIVLTQSDVRALQFAKGAISTGIETAMRALGLAAEDLDEVMLAGSFGSYINPRSAQVIGLVPAVTVDKIKAVGNTASEGLSSLVNSLPRRASVAAFLCLMVLHLLWPDMARSPVKGKTLLYQDVPPCVERVELNFSKINRFPGHRD